MRSSRSKQALPALPAATPPNPGTPGHEALLALAADAGLGVWSVDLASGTWFWSQPFRRILGLDDAADAGARGFLDRLQPGERPPGWADEDRARPPGLPAGTFRVARRDTGEPRWVTVTARAVPGMDGRAVRVEGTLRDVTDLKRAEAELRTSEVRLDAALRLGKMLVWDLDVTTGMVTRSANAVEMVGNRYEPIVDFARRVVPADRDKLIWESSDAPVPPEGDVHFVYSHPNGTELHLLSRAIKLPDGDAPGHVVGVTADITEQTLARLKLVHAADHDALTGLLSRKGWGQRIERALEVAARARARLHVVLLDVDLFKAINDSLGHSAGDCVLAAVGRRLAALPDTVAFAARLGGDEFAAVLRGEADVEAAGRAIIAAVGAPIAFGDHAVAVGSSLGTASFPEHGTTAADLLRNADLALYVAKQGGGRRTEPFRPAMRTALDERRRLEGAFRTALAEGRVIPHYQPKLDLETGALVGFEALARWVHPERGLLGPAAFESVFEDGPTAIEIGAAIRSAVLRDLGAWLAADLPVGRIAVNCSGHEFRVGDFAGDVLRDLRAAGVAPSRFELEVTENVMVGRHAEAVGRALQVLHDAGVKISLDDFGTGYASLIHLKQFPVDEIKVDRSFVAEMTQDANAVIIQAILGMGNSLGLTTVAEGVETLDQARALDAMGCKQVQGYLIGKPMSAERVPWFTRVRLPILAAQLARQAAPVPRRA